MSTQNKQPETAGSEPESPVVVWGHPDGRTIAVYPDHKRRYGYPNAQPAVLHTINQHLVDEWPVLRRETVGSLTDEEWYAAPDGEWDKMK